ncbi:MAG: hypothetical protein VKO21_08875 [Candidatus Sericytochromatia bacterium]|nr:hypothetical protein [Candidatus Sericytochromatia bacterium]
MALAALAAVSCGTSVGGGNPSAPQPGLPVLPQPVAPGPAHPVTSGLEDLLVRVAASTQIIRSYEALNQVQEWSGTKQQRSQSKLLFRPPATAKTEYTSGNAVPVGMVVLSQGGPTVQIKLPGALSFVRMTVSSRDSRARTLVGLYPDEVTPAAFVQMLRHPAARLSLLGRERVGARETALVRIEGARFPGGMDAAVVGFDALTGEWLLGRLYRQRQLTYETAYLRRIERNIADGELEL